MNGIQIFKNEEFGTVRAMEIDGEPWFVGKDVAEILGYKETAKAVRTHIDDEDKGVSVLDTPGGKQNITIINESGLYSLILSSKLPSAKKFKRWVTSEVLPTIRKTGGYVSDEELFVNTYLPNVDSATKELFKLNLRTIRQLNEKIENDKPLVDFANQVSDSCNAIDVSALAKLLNDENIKIGRNKLYKWMRSNKIIRQNNEPYQKYIDNGMLSCVEYVYHTPYGDKTGTKTLINGKGQIYIAEKLRKQYAKELAE